MRRRDFLGLSGSSLMLSTLFRDLPVEAQSAAPGPVVETAAGRLRGLAASSVVSFKGIRYGASTAGAHRFQPPQKPEPWTGIASAFEYGPRAWQPFRPMIPEIGDALTGNQAGLAEFMDLVPLMMQNLEKTVGPDGRSRIRLNVSTNLTQFAVAGPLCAEHPLPLCTGAGLTNPSTFPISASDPLGIVTAITGGNP